MFVHVHPLGDHEAEVTDPAESPRWESRPKPSDILSRARDLIVAGWCQGVAAKTSGGNSVAAISKSATRFDPSGAIEHVCDARWPLMPALNLLVFTIRSHGHDVQMARVWNDAPERTQDEVVAMFDAAIDEARKAGE